VPFDPNKPATGGPLSSAEIRENFRALKEDRIVDAGYLEGLTASAFVTRTTPVLITAVHTFNPSTAGAPFTLGANAQGQLVTGLNADMVDGQDASAFASATHNHDSSYAPINHNHDTTYVRKSTADTITAVHTFNPSSPGAPFILGANAQGQKVTGLNADMVDGQDASAFASASHNHDTTYVRKSTADTITAVHTFNPSSPGAPFILGANAQGRLITGLNADMVDGYHYTDFPRRYTSNITVTVGSGGDFSTINEALDYVVNTYAPYARSNGQSLSVEIKLKSGFVMREQVIVHGQDLSWIRITAEDPEVNVDANYLTTSMPPGSIYFGYPAFCAYDEGVLPIIGCLFSMINNSDEKLGIYIYNGGRCYIKRLCGFKNAYINLAIENNAIASAEGTYLNNASLFGIYVSDGHLYASQVDCSNSGLKGIRIYHSVANINFANASSCGTYGVECHSSIVIARGLIASGGQYGIYVSGGSIVINTASTATTNVTPNTISSNGLLIR